MDIIPFRQDIKFVPDILKFTNDEGNVEQYIIIALKCEATPYTVISPATSLLKCWSLKDKTTYEYARRIAEFLNYAYFERRIKKFEEIDTKLVIDFVNNLGVSHNRHYVQVTLNVLKKTFYYMQTNYPDSCKITRENGVYAKKKGGYDWDELETKILLPSMSQNEKKKDKLTNLDDYLVARFLNIALYEAPNCAFGFYLLFFGGLRASEVCHLTRADVPSRFPTKGYFYVNLKDEILNPNSKRSDLAQNKRNRKQGIIVVPTLFEPVKKLYKKSSNHYPVVVNRFGEAMTVDGFEGRFEDVKKKLIEQLKKSSSANDQLNAFRLGNFSWNTHIGRGYFSNLLTKYSQNSYNVAVARGDSSFTSVLPYLAESEETATKITDILETMLHGEKDDKNTDN